MSLKPRPEYTQEELDHLYPPSLRLQQVHVLMRHGERTPVSNRFVNTGLPEFWPYCTGASKIVSPIFDPSSSTWITLGWRRHFETFTAPNNQTPRLGAAAAGRNLSNAICDLGQLTDKGRRTTTALGRRLRRLYVDQLRFLPGALTAAADTKALYLRTTPIPRALESLQQAFHGLYPPNLRSPNLGPVTIHSRHWADETLLPNTANCARFAQMMRDFGRRAAQRWDNSPEMDRINAKLRKYMPKESPSSSSNVRIGVASHPTLVGVMDTITATAAHEDPATKLPADFYDARNLANADRIAVDEWFSGFDESREYRTLGIGGLLADMTERMVDSAQGCHGGVPLKFTLSGCHDSTIAAAIMSLGGGGGDGARGTSKKSSSSPSHFSWPPFTSHIAVELLRDDKVEAVNDATMTTTTTTAASGRIGRRPTKELTSEEKNKLRGYYVRVRYNDEPVTIPACRAAGNHFGDDESLCTLATFKSVVDGMTPTNWKAQCAANMGTSSFPSKPEPAGYLEE